MSDVVERLHLLKSGAAWYCEETTATLEDAADEIERLRAAESVALLDALRFHRERDKAQAERDRAVEARTEAIKVMADMSRQAGSWQGIAEGKDIVIRQLEAERDRLREALRYWLHDDEVRDFGEWFEVGCKISRAALKETGHE
jgi:hypothetical protein